MKGSAAAAQFCRASGMTGSEGWNYMMPPFFNQVRLFARDLPEGVVTIAHPFKGGLVPLGPQVPKGRLKSLLQNPNFLLGCTNNGVTFDGFSRPFGTYPRAKPNPAVNCRAILESASGRGERRVRNVQIPESVLTPEMSSQRVLALSGLSAQNPSVRGNTRGAAFNLFFLILAVFSFDSASGQNIVGPDSTSTFTANPVMLTDKDVSESFVWRSPDFSKRPTSPEAARIASKLDSHVDEFLQGAPWMPFHHTLGISGYEANFAHPDEMFLELAFAAPWVKPGTAAKLREFLAAQLRSGPAPYDESGFEFRYGHARESYDVPENLRRSGRSRAEHALGVYSFWAYCHYCRDAAAAREHWTRVKARMKPLLETDYAFDPRRTNYTRSESEKLNGDLAGLLGLGRLARLVNDADAERQAIARARQLLELRVNLDRLNPRIVDKSADATKGLHNFKLARYCALVPEIAEALRRHTDGCAAAHLKAFREERNGWHLAFGDRLIGGENYTNPLQLPRALFTGAAIIEQLPADQIAGFIDVPWCRGDLYFIEKCVLALWADAGRSWSKL